MQTESEKLLNDLSLLLVMLDVNDQTGFDALIELLSQLVQSTKKSRTAKRLHQAARFLLEQKDKLTREQFAQAMGSFISTAQVFCSRPEDAVFANEAAGPADPDLGANLDETLVVAFIEKHQLLLDEFEASVVEFRFGSDDGSERVSKFQSYVKGYVHSLKGDAGSVGLIGIERAAHSLEDMISEHGVAAVGEELLQFKEWVLSCIKAYSAKSKPAQTSEQFIEALHSTKAASAAPGKAAAPAQAAPSDLGEYTISADSDVLVEFTVEAEDHLNNIESILLEYGAALAAEQIDTVYRCVHSLKGASSYFNLAETTETSHKLENVLDEVRDGKRQLDSPLVELVFRYIDLQKKLITEAKASVGRSNKISRKQVVADYLRDLASYQSGTPAAEPSPASVEPPKAAAPETSLPEEPAPQTAEAPPAQAPVAESKKTSAAEAPAPIQESSAARDGKSAGRGLEIKTFVKVDTVRLDHLIESIGEMVIYSSMLVRSCRELLGENEQLVKTTHQVEKFSRELQDIGMSMRLDPIKGLFQKMSRLVWDVSRKIGKEVSFSMKGEDTEMDRTMIERLADPLMHMVRNAIDHGIEPPEERTAKGKPRMGQIELRAYQAGGSIHVEIIDDGRGLDPDKLRKKAVEKGLIPAEKKLSEQEAYRLIFQPGFSTAAQVTDISGRGVGMDVVRSNIESMRGHVVISSEVNRGSTFRIELPLTLAIMDGLETLVGPERFIIPTLSVVEIIRPTAEMLCYPLEREETFCFRSQFLPLYRVSSLFEIPAALTDPKEATVLVLENTGELVALMVDQVVGSCQTVIKSLGSTFKEGNGLAGCAIMSNGDIGLIIDVRSFVKLARSNYEFTSGIGSTAGVVTDLVDAM